VVRKQSRGITGSLLGLVVTIRTSETGFDIRRHDLVHALQA